MKLLTRFITTLLLLTVLLIQGSPLAAAKEYTEKELRALGIHYVGAPKGGNCDVSNNLGSEEEDESPLSDFSAQVLDFSRFTTAEQKIAQTFIVGITEAQAPSFLETVKKYPVGGVAVIGSHDDKVFNKAYFESLSEANGTPMLITADQEGGKVQRFDKTSAVGNQPSAKTMGAMSAEEVKAIGEQTGKGLLSLGVNVALAPVLDVDNGVNAISTMGRSFSSVPNTIIEKAGAFAEGLSTGGVKPVYKHFPGHGNATGNSDSDHGIVTTPSINDLRITDLVPYQQLLNKNNAAVMLGNLIVPGLTEDNTPTSLSPATVSLLRNEYGFTGLVMTDDLNAAGVKDQGIDLPSAIKRSLDAGVDAPLFSFTTEADLQSAIDQVKASVSSDKIATAVNHMISFKNIHPGAAAPSGDSATGTVTPSLPAGSSVYIVGDSITEMSTAAYKAAFQAKGISVTINSSAARSINGGGISGDKLSGLAAVEKDRAIIANSNAVVIALGTNGGESVDSIDRMYQAVHGINSQAKIYFVDTIAVGKPEYTATKTSNASMYAEASKFPYIIISWAKAVDPQSHPESLSGAESDPNKYIMPYEGQSQAQKDASLAVHVTSEGKTALANLVVTSLTTGSVSATATATGCCTVATTGSPGIAAGGTYTSFFHGSDRTLPPSWMPILKAAGQAKGVDPAFLAGILGSETVWTPPEAYIANPNLNSHGTIRGPFQFADVTASTFAKDMTNDVNKDGKVDVLDPTESAYMAAALLKSMGAGFTTPLGDAGDYGVARNNSDGKVTIRTIAAHYNQGGGWSSDKAVQGTNNVKKYMDETMNAVDNLRKAHAFDDVTGATPANAGCASTATTNALDDQTFVAYSQYDERWAKNPYGTYADGTRGTIASSGCGPTAMATIITFLTGNVVTPSDTAAFASEHDAEDNSGGSALTLATILAPNWKLTATPVELDVAKIEAGLSAGGLVYLGGMGGGDPYTDAGHYIVIRGKTPDGKWKIADSNKPENNKKTYDPTTVLAGAIKDSAYLITSTSSASQ